MKKITYLLASLFVASMFMACGSDDPPPQVIPVTGVTITAPTEIALYVTQTHQLEAVIAPSNASNPAVTWSSSAPTIASVSATGLVTAHATNTGTATITVTTTDGSFSATATITVATPAVLVQSVTIEGEDTLEFIVGEYKQLIAVLTPANPCNYQVDWESSDVDVVLVSPTGFVQAVGKGTATVTITTRCGNRTAYVTVNVSIIPVEYFTLYCETETGDAFEMDVEDIREFTVVILPADATHQSFVWKSSDTDVVEVSATGVVTAVGAGTATITVTSDCPNPDNPDDGSFYIEFEITVLPVGHPTEDEGVLIDGIRWATRNVGAPGTFAARPTSAGMFYQWGSNIGWFPITFVNASFSISNEGVMSNEEWPENAVTTVGQFWPESMDPCPPGWRVPTRAEFNSLANQPRQMMGTAALADEPGWNNSRTPGWIIGTDDWTPDTPEDSFIFLPTVGFLFWSSGQLSLALTGNRGSQYWTNETASAANGFTRQIHRGATSPFVTGPIFNESNVSGRQGNLVRCVAINP